jgi:hypothetical protein
VGPVSDRFSTKLGPPSPVTSTGFAPQCRLHKKSARETKSKGIPVAGQIAFRCLDKASHDFCRGANISIFFGAMDVARPYAFIGFGAVDATTSYAFIWFGAVDVTTPYDS